jgi:hypothetical protein
MHPNPRPGPLKPLRVADLTMTIDDRCPHCGALLALVGRTHPCVRVVLLPDGTGASQRAVRLSRSLRLASPSDTRAISEGKQNQSLKRPKLRSGWTAERRARHSAYMRELQRKKREAAAQ